MKHPEGHHLAEFNLGILKYDWDDPRVADFQNGLDLVNGVAMRSPGFVWMLDEEGMEAAQLDKNGALGGNPRTASTLSVWEDAASLEHFVWNTVHKRFYDRKAEWFEVMGEQHFVMWWVEEGHRPTLDEALDRLAHLKEHGPSDHAFGWKDIAAAKLYKTKQCDVAAE